MKIPHWVRCDWSVWGEPRDGVFEHVDLFGEKFYTAKSIQRRVCHVCKKVQIRRTDGRAM